jgi:hypothetical protein
VSAADAIATTGAASGLLAALKLTIADDQRQATTAALYLDPGTKGIEVAADQHTKSRTALDTLPRAQGVTRVGLNPRAAWPWQRRIPRR